MKGAVYLKFPLHFEYARLYHGTHRYLEPSPIADNIHIANGRPDKPAESASLCEAFPTTLEIILS